MESSNEGGRVSSPGPYDLATAPDGWWTRFQDRIPFEVRGDLAPRHFDPEAKRIPWGVMTGALYSAMRQNICPAWDRPDKPENQPGAFVGLTHGKSRRLLAKVGIPARRHRSQFFSDLKQGEDLGLWLREPGMLAETAARRKSGKPKRGPTTWHLAETLAEFQAFAAIRLLLQKVLPPGLFRRLGTNKVLWLRIFGQGLGGIPALRLAIRTGELESAVERIRRNALAVVADPTAPLVRKSDLAGVSDAELAEALKGGRSFAARSAQGAKARQASARFIREEGGRPKQTPAADLLPPERPTAAPNPPLQPPTDDRESLPPPSAIVKEVRRRYWGRKGA